MGCAFNMLALQKEANDWELKYLNGKRDFEYAQGQIERILIEEDLLKKELAKKESDTAREILKWLKAEVIMTEIPHGSEPCEENVEAVMWWQIEEHFKEKYGVDLGE